MKRPAAELESSGFTAQCSATGLCWWQFTVWMKEPSLQEHYPGVLFRNSTSTGTQSAGSPFQLLWLMFVDLSFNPQRTIWDDSTVCLNQILFISVNMYVCARWVHMKLRVLVLNRLWSSKIVSSCTCWVSFQLTPCSLLLVLWIEHTCMLVRWKQLSGEIARVTHSSFSHLSFACSSLAPLIVTSKKVKMLISLFSLLLFSCIQRLCADCWLSFGNTVAIEVLCTCAHVETGLD